METSSIYVYVRNVKQRTFALLVDRWRWSQRNLCDQCWNRVVFQRKIAIHDRFPIQYTNRSFFVFCLFHVFNHTYARKKKINHMKKQMSFVANGENFGFFFIFDCFFFFSDGLQFVLSPVYGFFLLQNFVFVFQYLCGCVVVNNLIQ